MFTKLKYTFIGHPLKSLTEGEGGLLGKTQALTDKSFTPTLKVGVPIW